MSEKRFSQYEEDNDGKTVIDNATGKICEFVDVRYAETCCKWLNNVNDENMELKQKYDDLKELLMNSEPVLEQKKLQELIYNHVDYLIAGKINEIYSKGENLECIRVLTDLRKELKE